MLFIYSDATSSYNFVFSANVVSEV